uniref:Chromo domain-containing protein n=1 Tax=Dunaliella viridis TaxID=140095 RepID=Q0ZBM6_9CHLO|nr:hypothetical protein [Dunaliella viridis]
MTGQGDGAAAVAATKHPPCKTQRCLRQGKRRTAVVMSVTVWQWIHSEKLVGKPGLKFSDGGMVGEIQLLKRHSLAAQQRQKHYADKKLRPLSFELGDEVLLSSKNLKTLSHPNCTPKLLPKWLGPFPIIGKCAKPHSPQNDAGEEVLAYKLELPEYMKIHPVFHVSLLKPYRRDGRVQPPPMPVTVEGEEWFLVEAILDHKDELVEVKPKTKHSPAKHELQRFYHVKWLGMGEEENSWEPEDNVRNLDIFPSYLAYRKISPLSP